MESHPLCAETFNSPSDLFRNSMEERSIPSEWKRPNVVPISKKGNRENSLNYRPVPLTSIVSKILERIIREQEMVECLQLRNYLVDRLQGLRRKRSRHL